MVRIKPLEGIQKKEVRDIIITISLAMYIFSNYWIRVPRLMVLGSLVLYLFLGITLLKLITNQTPLKITSYSIGYLAFGVLGALSYTYALVGDYVFADLYIVFVSFILTFSFTQYIRNHSSFLRIFSFYAYFPIFLVLYLVASGTLQNPGQRLGDYEFGNANNLAIVMMITLCCIFWFMVYGKARYLLINTPLAVVYLYVLSLSGGRKYLLVPFIFLFLVLVFKYWRESKSKLVVYLIFFSFIVVVGVWAIFNIPVLYNQVGVRFEGLFSFISGDLASTDSSTMLRYIMIENGWRWFLLQPIQGFGLNNYRVLLAEIMGDSGVYAHNNYIELMVDLGVIGLLLYYSFYFYIFLKLFGIKDDNTGIRNFFLAMMLALLFFDIGAVTYQLYIVQIFIALASAYVWLYEKNYRASVNEPVNSQ